VVVGSLKTLAICLRLGKGWEAPFIMPEACRFLLRPCLVIRLWGGLAISAPNYLVAEDGFGGGVYNAGSFQISGSTLAGNGALGGNAYDIEAPSDTLYLGNGWGGAFVNTGFVQFSSTILSSNVTGGVTNFGEAIYSTGAIESDTNSSLIPFVTGTPPLTYQWQLDATNISGDTNAVFDLGNIQFADAATYSLVISNAGGLVTNFVEIINLPPAPLALSSVTPNVGPPGGGTSVTIAGTGFTNGAKVYFGSAAATAVTVVSATNITATTPPATAYGTVDVTITNGGDFQPVVLAGGFTYYLPPQNFSGSVIPGQGAGLAFTGTPGCSYVLFVTTNLSPPINWQPIITNMADTNGNWTYTDTNAQGAPARYYRAMLQ
jgi:hypothetical protein